MKKVAFFITAVLIAFTAAGQTESGNILLGGTGTGIHRTSDGPELSYLQVNPFLGKFIADNGAFIGELNIGYAYSKNNFSSQNVLSVGLLPGFKGFIPLGEQLYFTPLLKAGYIYNRNHFRNSRGWPVSGKEQFSQIVFKAGIGLAAFFNTNAAFTIDLPYAHYVDISGSNHTYGQVELLLGFIIVFPSNNSE